MSISPFSVRPFSPGGERRRARLVVFIAIIGIGATLLAYAISPGVRHAVHSVKHDVSHILDRDQNEHKPAKHPAHPAAHPAHPAKTGRAQPSSPAPSGQASSAPRPT